MLNPHLRISCALIVLASGISHSAPTDELMATLAPATNGWTLSWNYLTPGTGFVVQYKDSLAEGIWRTPLMALPLSSQEWTDMKPATGARFFRIAGVPLANRGRILSISKGTTMPTNQLAFLFGLGGVPITPRYNVQRFKLVYETVSVLGARTTASGAVLLPESTGRLLPTVVYQHATLTQTNQAPSMLLVTSESAVGLALATSGYAAVLPDYLGFGESPWVHPYHHARSQATAAVDLLRAAKTFCSTNGFPLSESLFLTGYSQGGHAAMALCRELEMFHTNEFEVTACAPMAGAYDLSVVTTADLISERPQPAPYYFLYLLAAFQEVYDLAPSLSDLLVAPYNTSLPPLMAGNSTPEQITAAMPANPLQILRAEFRADFQNNPNNPLRLALQENDVHRWRPRTQMRLFHCAADQNVLYQNSVSALASFHQQGATQVELIDPLPNAGHADCAQPALLQAKLWFDSLR